MPNIRHLTLKSKLYAVITVLGLLPGVATAVSFFLLKASDEAQVALDKASQGTIHLEHINGLVYAVVMELRGIYMSADAKQAEPFEAFLAAVTSGLEERRRAERRESQDNIGVTVGGKAHRLQMLDRSEVGVRITLNPGLQKGSDVTADVGDGPVRATVVWTSPTEAGLSFDQGLAAVPSKRTMPSAERPSAAA